MHAVAKDNRAHRTLHGNIHRAAMTSAAVALDTKRCPSVMAGPAGRTVLHLLHADLITVGLGLKGVRMTFVTGEHSAVLRMTEGDGPDIFGLYCHIDGTGMAFGTVASDAESIFSVVTGSAGRAVFHFFHPDLVAVGFGPEHIGVAFATREVFGVIFMAEKNGPDATLDSDILRVGQRAGMTGGACLADPESRVAIMAGTAGFAILHPGHANLVAVGLGDKKIRMTFSTAEHLRVDVMTERNSADILSLNRHVSGVAVTGHTVASDTKRGIAIMAGAAGFSGFHLFHTDLVAVGFGFKGVRMTFVTTEHLDMRIVAENNRSHRTLDGDILCALMTTSTIGFDTEGAIAIMTGTAGFSAFHLLHANLGAVGLGPEGLRMTFVATEHFGVDDMAEDNPTHRTLYRDIFGVGEIPQMAGGAIFADTKSGVTIVTGATRLTGFHALHTHLVAIGFGDKNIRVTFCTT